MMLRLAITLWSRTPFPSVGLSTVGHRLPSKQLFGTIGRLELIPFLRLQDNATTGIGTCKCVAGNAQAGKQPPVCPLIARL